MHNRYAHWANRKTGNEREAGKKKVNRHRVVKRAKVLNAKQLETLLDFVENGRHPLRDRVMILLSYKAGLRSQEIAGLDWSALCDAEGELHTEYFTVGSHIAKYGHERAISMHVDLYIALEALRDARPNGTAVIYGVRKPRMSPNNVTVYFHELYKKLGFQGCSSHSGRRTFITSLARKANLHGCSLKDVQLAAGHRQLSSTECYLEPSPNIGRLVASI